MSIIIDTSTKRMEKVMSDSIETQIITARQNFKSTTPRKPIKEGSGVATSLQHALEVSTKLLELCRKQDENK